MGRLGGPEINPYSYSLLIFKNGTIRIKWKKYFFSTHGPEQLYIHIPKNGFG